MAESQVDRMPEAQAAEARWTDLCRIGGVASIALPGVIVAAIVAYLVCPYKPGTTSVADIFALLQRNRLAGLISLDLSVPILLPIIVLQMLALYAALRQASGSYASVALVLGLMGIVLWLSARPLAEMAYLSDRYLAAASEAEKGRYLAAGEASNALF